MSKHSSIKRIICITFAKFPSQTAHSVSIIKMCQSIATLGYDLTLFADFQKEASAVFEFYDIKLPFKIKHIKLVNIRFFGRIFFLIKAFLYIRKYPPDMLYTRDIFCASFARILNLPSIYEIHEPPDTFLRRTLMKTVVHNTNLKCLVIISQKLKRMLENYTRNLHKHCQCIVAHDGVDLESFQFIHSKSTARKVLNMPENAFIAGYTGSLYEGRGIDLILKVATHLKNDIFIIVGGSGKHLTHLRKKVKNLQHYNLIIKEFIPHKLIPVYLRAFDILLMPYQKKVFLRNGRQNTASYMSPLKMFEYMASGRPIISSRLDVIEEVLKDKKNAMLVPADDRDEWEKSIMILKKNRNLGEKIAKQAREDVKNYSWDERARKIFAQIF